MKVAARRGGPSWIRGYRRAWLGRDILGGLTVAALLVPEGLAYAELAGVPPQTAFYAAPAAMIAYALLGSSRQLVVSVSSTVAVLSASTVSRITDAGTKEYLTLTAALAIIGGLISLLAGMAGLGRIARFFSEAVLFGFVFGLALVIVVGQLPKLTGLENVEGDFFEKLWGVVRSIGEMHLPTLLVGMGTLVLLVVLERHFDRIPASLVALVVGIIAGQVLHLQDQGVAVVGELEGGIAMPKIPSIPLSALPLLIVGGLGIAIVAFAEAIGPARSFAKEHGQRIDAEQELVGIGAANMAAGIFQGFPIGSSLSKSAASDRAGTKTPLALLVGAAATILVALFLVGVFRTLPEPTLGAIVVVAVSGMMKIATMRRYRTLSRSDFALALLAMFGVLLFGVLPGLGLAVLTSLGVVVWEAATPRLTVMTPQTVADALDAPDLVPALDDRGVWVLRPDENVFFANASALREEIVDRIESAESKPSTLVLDLSATMFIKDLSTSEELVGLCEDLRGQGVTLVLARVNPRVAETFRRTGVTAAVGDGRIVTRVLAALVDHDERSGRLPDAALLERSAAALLSELLRNMPPGAPQVVTITEAINALAPPPAGRRHDTTPSGIPAQSGEGDPDGPRGDAPPDDREGDSRA